MNLQLVQYSLSFHLLVSINSWDAGEVVHNGFVKAFFFGFLVTQVGVDHSLEPEHSLIKAHYKHFDILTIERNLPRLHIVQYSLSSALQFL